MTKSIDIGVFFYARSCGSDLAWEVRVVRAGRTHGAKSGGSTFFSALAEAIFQRFPSVWEAEWRAKRLRELAEIRDRADRDVSGKV